MVLAPPNGGSQVRLIELIKDKKVRRSVMERRRSGIRRRLPTHATIAAYLALFFALGGVGYAASQLPAGSVARHSSATAR